MPTKRIALVASLAAMLVVAPLAGCGGSGSLDDASSAKRLALADLESEVGLGAAGLADSFEPCVTGSMNTSCAAAVRASAASLGAASRRLSVAAQALFGDRVAACDQHARAVRVWADRFPVTLDYAVSHVEHGQVESALDEVQSALASYQAGPGSSAC